jgi:hypothetical protein
MRIITVIRYMVMESMQTTDAAHKACMSDVDSKGIIVIENRLQAA